jgi:uncharacterized phage-like protein YoqJ
MNEIPFGKSCCFTGHRPEKLNVTEDKIKPILRDEIEKAVSDGFTVFISGMARGIDMWAAELVLGMRINSPDLKLVCAVPYDGFEKKWKMEERMRYSRILNSADMVKIVCRHYSPYVFQMRNVWMVDRSERVIAAYRGNDGGTKNTIKYAQRVGIEVCYV